MSGKINLTVGEMQGNLRQLLESDINLSPEQRYSLVAAIETIDFLKKISPGLRKALGEHGSGKGAKQKRK